ncbi:MAG: hypothetical protein ABGZ31_07210, partial [Roseibacillus sp.]
SSILPSCSGWMIDFFALAANFSAAGTSLERPAAVFFLVAFLAMVYRLVSFVVVRKPPLGASFKRPNFPNGEEGDKFFAGRIYN